MSKLGRSRNHKGLVIVLIPFIKTFNLGVVDTDARLGSHPCNQSGLSWFTVHMSETDEKYRQIVYARILLSNTKFIGLIW
jgi:hypothetical protein